eukprot:1157396-Pelagomonas_calceolata.AAC.5
MVCIHICMAQSGRGADRCCFEAHVSANARTHTCARTHTLLQEKNAEKILFGYDQVVEAHGPRPQELIIVEGEMDVLALYEAGFTNVVSVPDGGWSCVWGKHICVCVRACVRE